MRWRGCPIRSPRIQAAAGELIHLPVQAEAVLALERRLLHHHPYHDRRAETGRTGDERRLVHRLYLPVSVCAEIPALTEDPFRLPSEAYTLLSGAGWDLRWVEHVRAAIPTPEDTTTLALPPGTPVLITRRVTTDTHHRPAAMEVTRRSGPHCRHVCGGGRECSPAALAFFIL